MQLFDRQGSLYFTEDERKAFLNAATKAPREVRSFCGVLNYTGRRIFEALALTLKSIDLSGKVIVFESLKKRRRGSIARVGVGRASRHARHDAWRPRNPEEGQRTSR